MPRKIRPIRIEGNLAFIPLTQGLEAVIDAADVHLVDGCNWYADKHSKVVYAATHIKLSDGRQTTLKLHRALMPSATLVDHRDEDGLNNRRENLRDASNSENLCNRGRQRNNTSGYKGVTLDRRSGRWQAKIMKNYKTKHLGMFATAAEAHKAYCHALALTHGKFGRGG